MANADQLVIVCSLADPPPRTGFIDRCLVAAYDADIEPLLCLTKADLAGPDDVLGVLRRAGPAARAVLARPPADRRCEDALRDRLSVLVGHSGVGKSTLVNRLVPDADRAVGVVSAIGKGRHTSTSVGRAGRCPAAGGSWTRRASARFGIAHVDPDNVLHGFPELVDAIGELPAQLRPHGRRGRLRPGRPGRRRRRATPAGWPRSAACWPPAPATPPTARRPAALSQGAHYTASGDARCPCSSDVDRAADAPVDAARRGPSAPRRRGSGAARRGRGARPAGSRRPPARGSAPRARSAATMCSSTIRRLPRAAGNETSRPSTTNARSTAARVPVRVQRSSAGAAGPEALPGRLLERLDLRRSAARPCWTRARRRSAGAALEPTSRELSPVRARDLGRRGRAEHHSGEHPHPGRLGEQSDQDVGVMTANVTRKLGVKSYRFPLVTRYADDLALAHVLADTADSIAMARFRAQDLQVTDEAGPDAGHRRRHGGGEGAAGHPAAHPAARRRARRGVRRERGRGRPEPAAVGDRPDRRHQELRPRRARSGPR